MIAVESVVEPVPFLLLKRVYLDRWQCTAIAYCLKHRKRTFGVEIGNAWTSFTGFNVRHWCNDCPLAWVPKREIALGDWREA